MKLLHSKRQFLFKTFKITSSGEGVLNLNLQGLANLFFFKIITRLLFNFRHRTLPNSEGSLTFGKWIFKKLLTSRLHLRTLALFFKVTVSQSTKGISNVSSGIEVLLFFDKDCVLGVDLRATDKSILYPKDESAGLSITFKLSNFLSNLSTLLFSKTLVFKLGIGPDVFKWCETNSDRLLNFVFVVKSELTLGKLLILGIVNEFFELDPNFGITKLEILGEFEFSEDFWFDRCPEMFRPLNFGIMNLHEGEIWVTPYLTMIQKENNKLNKIVKNNDK